HGFYLYQPRLATDPVLHKKVEPVAVYELDRSRVVAADLLLLLLNKPSLGVGQEIEIAASYGKPVILIVEEGVEVSRMVLGAPLQIVRKIVYESPESLTRQLDEAFEAAAPLVERWRSRMGAAMVRVGSKIAGLRVSAGFKTQEELAEA